MFEWFRNRILPALLLPLMLTGCISPQVKLTQEEIGHSSVPATRETTIALIVATGMAGRYILQRALAEGYPVKVLARTPAKLQDLASRVEIVEGDALDPVAIQSLITGSDVVITALGPVKSDGAAAQMITTRATGNVIEAMQGEKPGRYIVVSGAAVVVPGDQRNFIGWWMRQLVKLRLGELLEDRQAEYQLLADSAIDWTLVRCPLIDSEDYKNAPRSSLKTPSSFHLRAGELANFIIREVEEPSYRRQAPFLYSVSNDAHR